jgi:hypothetical protein
MTTNACYLGKVPLQPLLGTHPPQVPGAPASQDLRHFSMDDGALMRHKRTEGADCDGQAHRERLVCIATTQDKTVTSRKHPLGSQRSLGMEFQGQWGLK